ncbi:MAG: ester cyclase [Candidatus Dormibacteria bacterium]
MPSTDADIRERLAWPASADAHERIRRLWIDHSKAEDARDLDGLIATLTEDCVYELVPTGELFTGHDGARRFYTTFLGAYPDVHFALTDIVVGPQGVVEIATMTGTQVGAWSGVEGRGQKVSARVIIHFPWDPDRGRFKGERVYYNPADFE